MDPPRIVNTPEKAKVYAEGLLREIKFLDRVVAELPDYVEDLPGKDEIKLRLQSLTDRIDKFRDGRVAGS